MAGLKTGDKVPLFSLPDQDGKLFDIGSLLGRRNLVIFFYPQDESPACTREVCYFRDLYDAFIEANAEVIGISGQSVDSHNAFAGKNLLPYRILSDEGNRIRKLFGVPSFLFGTLPGRVTYIIDSEGKIVHVFSSQLRPEKHADEALKILFLLKGTVKRS
ncbi:MAG TPA: peroxiredoxin [Bacteroidales bacterium]|nr:peroxiredoxin [Bacteroidales bacterium]HRT89265.1 peroxiredoxin [Bacteroidales bacterium]